MAHAQNPDFVFRRTGRVHLNRRGRQFSRLLAAEVWASAVVMLNTPCSEAVWRVLATHSIRQCPLHFPSRASPCAVTFQLESTAASIMNVDSFKDWPRNRRLRNLQQLVCTPDNRPLMVDPVDQSTYWRSCRSSWQQWKRCAANLRF